MLIIKKRKHKKRIRKRERTVIDYVLTVSLLSVFLIIFQVSFVLWEKFQGLVAGEASDSITVSVSVVPSISIDSPSDVSLSPNIQETGSATGSATWNVKTNNTNGWRLDLNASGSPAMKSGSDSFADYTESSSGVPEAWSIASSDSEFGFSTSGSYAESGFSGGKYLGFNGTTRIKGAHRDTQSGGSGDDITVDFKAEVGSGHNQPEGTYSATVTATATTL